MGRQATRLLECTAGGRPVLSLSGGGLPAGASERAALRRQCQSAPVLPVQWWMTQRSGGTRQAARGAVAACYATLELLRDAMKGAYCFKRLACLTGMHNGRCSIMRAMACHLCAVRCMSCAGHPQRHPEEQKPARWRQLCQLLSTSRYCCWIRAVQSPLLSSILADTIRR